VTGLGLVLIVSAWASAHALDAPSMGARYDELCRYDTWCTKLKTPDGEFVGPRAGVLPLVSTLGPTIRDISARLSIDPTAVAGAVVAGQSLTQTIDDDTVAFFEKIHLLPIANAVYKMVRGKSFSLGIGQIKPETANEAEALLARAERRPPRTPDEVRNALLLPAENVKYVAAIERACQDAYGRRGMNVNDDPALLATLYNLGGCPRRAERDAEAKRTPRVNFFGFFVDRYRGEIERAVDGVPGAPPATLATATLARRLRDDVGLRAAPPGCDGGPSASPAVAVARGEYRVLAPGVDCALKDWSLVASENGAVGWASNRDLEKSGEDFVETGVTRCDPAVNVRCLERVRAKLGAAVLGTDAGGLLQIALRGGPADPDHARVRQFRPGACAARWISAPLPERGPEDVRVACAPLFEVSPQARRAFAQAPPDAHGASVSAICHALIEVRAAWQTKTAPKSMDDLTRILAAHVSNDSDVDDVLVDAIAAAGSTGPACTYDPVASARVLDRLGDEPCVEMVFTPDESLISGLGTTARPAVFKPFEDDDRFAVKLKDGCSRVRAAAAESGRSGASR
jgi:hypothetical protein